MHLRRRLTRRSREGVWNCQQYCRAQRSPSSWRSDVSVGAAMVCFLFCFFFFFSLFLFVSFISFPIVCFHGCEMTTSRYYRLKTTGPIRRGRSHRRPGGAAEEEARRCGWTTGGLSVPDDRCCWGSGGESTPTRGALPADRAAAGAAGDCCCGVAPAAAAGPLAAPVGVERG